MNLKRLEGPTCLFIIPTFLQRPVISFFKNRRKRGEELLVNTHGLPSGIQRLRDK